VPSMAEKVWKWCLFIARSPVALVGRFAGGTPEG